MVNVELRAAYSHKGAIGATSGAASPELYNIRATATRNTAIATTTSAQGGTPGLYGCDSESQLVFAASGVRHFDRSHMIAHVTDEQPSFQSDPNSSFHLVTRA